MDPDETLKRIRALAARIIAVADKDDEDMSSEGLELAELVQALDTWIASGGFLPRAWENRRTVPLPPVKP